MAESDFLKDSIVRNPDGTLMTVYHGTSALFDSFEFGDIGFHFGTKEHAENRMSGYGGAAYILECYLNIKKLYNPCFDYGCWDGAYVADMSIEREEFGEDINSEDNKILLGIAELSEGGYNSEASVAMRNFLISKGYDGIVYPNIFEGRCSSEEDNYSYIAFSNDQIFIANRKVLK